MKSVFSRGLIFLLSLGLPLWGVAKPPSVPLRAKGICVPIYQPGQPKPMAVVRIAETYKDHQRRGFFRIGVLPLWVAEGVRIELLTPDAPNDLLTQVTQAVHSPDPALRGTLELRSLQIWVAGFDSPRLEAGRVRISRDGSWELLEGVIWRTRTQTHQAMQAKLLCQPHSAEGPCLQIGGTPEARRIPLLSLEHLSSPLPSPARTSTDP